MSIAYTQEEMAIQQRAARANVRSVRTGLKARQTFADELTVTFNHVDCGFCDATYDPCYPLFQNESLKAARKVVANQMHESGWRYVACDECGLEAIACPDCAKSHEAHE